MNSPILEWAKFFSCFNKQLNQMRTKMKKAVATLFLVGSTLALAACDSNGTGNVDVDPPYALERTAEGNGDAVVTPDKEQAEPGDKVFQKAQIK